MSAGLIAGRNKNKAAVLDVWDFALHHAELRRIQLVVGEIYGQKPGLDPVELRSGIVIVRRFELVEEVIRVHFPEVGHVAVIQFIRLGARGRLFLQAHRAFRHEIEDR